MLVSPLSIGKHGVQIMATNRPADPDNACLNNIESIFTVSK